LTSLTVKKSVKKSKRERDTHKRRREETRGKGRRREEKGKKRELCVFGVGWKRRGKRRAEER